jgi:hypothetical protein
MYLLHERTRKSVCRIGFVALCALPTCAVGLWSAVWSSDAHRVTCEAEVSRVLRLKVALGGVEYLEPGAVRYSDFSIADPETGARVAYAAKLEVRMSSSALAITAAQLTVECGAARTIADLLQDRLRQRTHSGDVPIRLTLGKLIAASTAGDIPLTDARFRLEPTSEGRGAQLTFRTPAMPKDAEPVMLTIVRNRNAQTGVQLDTRGAFRNPADRLDPLIELLRTLVANNDQLVPVTREAEELVRLPPARTSTTRTQ